MKINLRLKLHDLTFYMMISKTQHLKGINSLIERNDEDITKALHILFWDLEDCSLKQAVKELNRIKKQYDIRHKIYITSDKPRSYHAYCSHLTYWKTYLQILLETKYLDWGFFYWAVRLNKATLRQTPKINRQKRELKEIISDPNDFPDNMFNKIEVRFYDAGHVKKGHTLAKELLIR